MTKQALRKWFNDRTDKVLEPSEQDEIFFRLVEFIYQKNQLQWIIEEPEIEEEDWEEIIAELENDKPIQYIIGKEWFNGMEIVVDDHVLIPRPETKELVDWVTETAQNGEQNFIDIGTGSGCIALSIKKAWPKANVFATDISSKALDVARQNAQRQQMDIQFIEDDILKSELVHNEFDVIISNPPYILPKERNELSKRVKSYEPSIALFTEVGNALQFYKAITAFASKTLSEQGYLFFELHEKYAEATKNMCLEYYEDVVLKEDIYGKQRMLRATKKR